MSSKTPISTLTLNPAIDVSYVATEMVPNRKVSATESQVDPGGNGINVARVLHRLNYNVKACCIVAGESGRFLLDMLHQRTMKPEHITVEGETRTNCTIQQRRPPQELKVKGVGPRLQMEHIEAISECFLKNSGNGYGVLSGSITVDTPNDLYATLCEKLNQQGARAVVDVQGDALLSAIEAKPYLIKPNKYELELLMGHSLRTPELLAEVGRGLQEQGAHHVCISLGEDGAMLLDGENTYLATAPKIHMRSTAGVGDAMVAGLIAALANNKSSEDVLSFGIACGSSAAANTGTGLVDPAKLPDLKSAVEVRVLDI